MKLGSGRAADLAKTYHGRMSQDSAVKLGVAGLGGYARQIIDLVGQCGAQCDPAVQLTAVCDPNLIAHPEVIDSLKAMGVAIYDDYQKMLGHAGLEAVWLPVPIDLHIPFAEAALAQGLAVMIEKPVAGTIDELDRLIAARDAAGRPVLVGFQDVYDAVTLPLKQRLVSGGLGKLRRASVWGCWPRDTQYFGRASWAGAIKRGDTWVLDSPVNNAMAHFVNIVLFLLGPEPTRSAVPTAIEAELYRAAKIENYDTAAIRVSLQDQADFLVLLTHACRQQIGPTIDLETDRGHVRWTPSQLTITLDGQTNVQTRDGQMRWGMLDCYAKVIRGLPHPKRHAATLEVARSHALIVNGVSQATAVRPVPDDQIVPVERDAGKIYSIPGIEELFEHCAAEGKLLHESGQLPFTAPPGRLDLQGYTHFAGVPAG